LSGEGIPGPLAAVAQEGMRLHRVFAHELEAETGIDVEYRQRPSISLAFTEDEVRRAQAEIKWHQQQPGYAVRWLDDRETRSLEPRIAETILGSVLMEQGADVEPYRLVLALTRAAGNRGTRIRHGRVIGLTRRGGRVTSVVLEHYEISCNTVVLALGPWSEATSE
jgi:glycine/D-amino acid oxidase-like deaminating enzyme